MNNIKIKPCPFCGHEAILKINREHLYIVQCDKCEATSKICESENEAAEAWNTRKPMDKVVEQLEEASYSEAVDDMDPYGDIPSKVVSLQTAHDIVRNGGRG